MFSDVQIDDKEFDIPQVDTPPTLESILNEVSGPSDVQPAPIQGGAKMRQHIRLWLFSYCVFPGK